MNVDYFYLYCVFNVIDNGQFLLYRFEKIDINVSYILFILDKRVTISQSHFSNLR